MTGLFSASGTDPDDDLVQYRFDWDDGTISSWTNLGASGHTDSLSHSWGSPGTYVVKAQARDEHLAISGWSSGLTVVVSVVEPPEITVDILSPVDGLYFIGFKILPLPTNLTLVYGRITIEANAKISEGSIDKVEFYIDNQLMKTVQGTEFEWYMREKINGMHYCTIKAYDQVENIDTQTFEFMKFF